MAADVEKTTAAAERRVFFAVLFAHGFARVLSKLASAPLERVKASLPKIPFTRLDWLITNATEGI